MTREEREQALEWFKNRPITMSGAKKMYDLAISALEQPEPCEDTISRQAAIDAIEEMQMPIMRSEFPEEQFVFTGMSEALRAIKDLPSVQPDKTYEQGWKDGREALRKEMWEDGRDRLD